MWITGTTTAIEANNSEVKSPRPLRGLQVDFSLTRNLVPRACDPPVLRGGNGGSSRLLRFPHAVQGDRRLWGRDCLTRNVSDAVR